MTLVEHARRELELCGQTASDPAYAQSIICAVAALATYGHSGGSMGCAIAQLHDLLQYRPLSPLTNNPDEWVEVGDEMWQNRRDSAAFSHDRGATYSYVDERPGRHMTIDVRHEPPSPGPRETYVDEDGANECAPPPLTPITPDDPYPPLTRVDDVPEEAG